MRKNIQAIILATALLATAPLFGQEAHSKMGKMGMKMSHEEMTAKMDKMSVDEKAVLIDNNAQEGKNGGDEGSGPGCE